VDVEQLQRQLQGAIESENYKVCVFERSIAPTSSHDIEVHELAAGGEH
jgi:hypothetical protein